MRDLIPLHDILHLRFSGPDAERYLNGQLTQQVSGINEGDSRSTFICDVKGRILFNGTIHRDEEGFLLSLEDCDWEEAFARMDRYLIADDCEISDESDKWHLLHEKSEQPQQEGLINRFGQLGRDHYLTTEQLNELSDDTFLLNSKREQEELRVQNGIPRRPDLTGAFPAETGREDEAVSFHKGCYLGQEVISRMKRAGKTNRKLIALTLPQQPSCCPLSFSAQGNDKILLEVTSASAKMENGSFPALGYLNSRYKNGTELTSEEGISVNLST